MDLSALFESCKDSQGWTDAQVKGAISDFEDLLSEDGVKRELTKLRLWQEAIKYEGFDPVLMATRLRIAAETLSKNIEADKSLLVKIKGEVESSGKTVMQEYTNNMSFSSDMRFLCLLFVCRGAAYKKIMDKSSQFGLNLLQMMVDKYDISTEKRRPGTQLGSGIVTITRIAACFPTVTVDLIHEGLGRTLVSSEEIVDQDYIWPRVMTAPMLASVIPKSVYPEMQLLAVAVATDELLHRTGSKTKLTNILQYMRASNQSSVVSTLSKISYCKRWGLLDKDGNLVAGVRDSRARTEEYIRTKRSGDTELNVVLASVSH